MAKIIVDRQFVGDITFDQVLLWILPVTIQGERKKFTFNMLLDTGAERTVLLPDVHEIVGITWKQELQKGTGVGGSSTYRIGIVENIEIVTIPLGSLEVLIGRLPGVFSKYKIDGILGADALGTLCLKIDYPNKLLEISKTIVLPDL